MREQWLLNSLESKCRSRSLGFRVKNLGVDNYSIIIKVVPSQSFRTYSSTVHNVSQARILIEQAPSVGGTAFEVWSFQLFNLPLPVFQMVCIVGT